MQRELSLPMLLGGALVVLALIGGLWWTFFGRRQPAGNPATALQQRKSHQRPPLPPMPTAPVAR